MSLQAAVIGTGMVAKTHIMAIAASDAVRLKGVFSRNSQRLEQFNHGINAEFGMNSKVYPSVSAIAEDEEIDFAIVVTPPNARLAITKTLAAAGKPILMEKPVERSTAAAIELVDICEHANIPLGIVFQHRMNDSAHQLRSLLAGGQLGELAIANVRVPWWREQAYYDEPGRGSYERDGGGVLISQAIHALDLALSFTGPAKRVSAFVRTSSFHRMESEDYVHAGIEFQRGTIGSVSATTAHYPGGSESIELLCTNASVKLAAGTLSVDWRDGRSETFGATKASGGGADPMAFSHESHQRIIENFAAAVAKGSPLACSGREALHVHRLIDAMVESGRRESAVEVQSA